MFSLVKWPRLVTLVNFARNTPSFMAWLIADSSWVKVLSLIPCVSMIPVGDMVMVRMISMRGVILTLAGKLM